MHAVSQICGPRYLRRNTGATVGSGILSIRADSSVMQQLLGEMFSVGSLPRLYNADQI
jgi:hypothetical protein